LVEEGIILSYKLVLDILKDGPDISEGEDVIATFILNNLVVSVVEGQVLHGWHRSLKGICCGSKGFSELAKDHVASVDDEGKVGPSGFLVEQELELLVDTEPVEE
jgi:hypothetical protein